MNSGILPVPVDTNEEVMSLIKTLIETERRLEEITHGEVDSVVDDEGRPFLLGRAQEQLRYSEKAKQASILNALPAHIALLDVEGVIISVNEAWRRFADANVLHAPGHAVGISYLDVCDRARGAHSSEARQVAAGIRAVLDRLKPSYSIEYPCHSPTEQRWFELMVTPLADDHANGVVVMHLNVTARKQSEETLRASEASLSAAQRIAHFGSWEQDLTNLEDPSANPLSWSDEMYRIAGYEPGGCEVTADFFFQLVPEAERHAIHQEFASAIRERREYSIVHSLVRPNGEARTVQEMAQVSFDPNGRAVRVSGTCHDITESKLAEGALRERDERLRAALSASGTGTFRWDFQTGELEWDESLDGLFGLPRGVHVRSLEAFAAKVHPDDRPELMEQCGRCKEAGADFAMEFRIVWPDGSERWLDDRGKTFFDTAGKPLYMTGACVDITERKQAAAKLEEFSQRTERRERMLSAALASMSDFAQIYDRQGRFLFANKPLLDLWGIPLEAVVGKNFRELGYPSELADRLQSELRKVFATGQSITGETPYSKPAGQSGFYEYIFSPGLGSDGKVDFVVGSTRDITERKRNEMAIRDSNEKFHQLADNITDAFWIRSPDFSEVQYVSPAFEKIWGRSVASLQANPRLWAELVFVEDRERVLFAFSQLSAQTPSLEIEYRIVRPDGEIRWVRVRGFKIRNATDQRIRHIGVVTDITEWRQATDALRTSEAEFRTLAESMPQIVWETGADGGNIYFNQQWIDYTGLTLAESRGAGWIKPFHPDDREKARISWEAATAVAGTYSIESRLRRADGVYRWWLVRGVPLRGAGGQIFKWVGTCTDINELKLAQERMSQQAALLDIAQDAILVKDLQNRIIYWNKGAERTYGWTSEEAIGSNSLELFQRNPQARQEASAKLFAHGSWQGEMTNRTKAGSEITVDVRWTLVRDSDGQANAVLAIHTDITDKKKLEGQFLRVQRMESIGTLASGIAHDLNNVLAPIMMSVEMLQDIALRPEDKSLLVTLQSCAQRGANLIKQVLSFARGVEGRRVSINVFHVIRDIENIVRDTFPKNVSFELKRPRDVGTVLGDPTQLHQVFMNLCVNSRDAMPLGGKLTVTLENVVLDENYAGMNPDAKAGPYTMIKVEDTGSGIPLAIQNKIFEPFYTTKEIGKGTGLGLSTTMAIIKSHGGFISLYSESGKGAQFRVYLPAAMNSTLPNESEVEQNTLPYGEGELVLVVDDEESIRIITERTLERFNYRTLLAKNGAEAVAMYAMRGSEIAVVLTDMAMPIMDGPALIVALIALNPKVKIIGCSGHASHHSVANAMGAGVQHFIPKPYPAEILLKTLRLVLKGGEEKSGIEAIGAGRSEP